MIIIENIKESFTSIRANLLRSNLTALIISIGIMALIGILTAVDSLKSSINSSFSSLGSNTLEIRNKSSSSGHNVRRGGKKRKRHRSISYKEALHFSEKFDYPGTLNLVVKVSGDATAKSRYAKSNPNITVYGTDEKYIDVQKFSFKGGRNFSNLELIHGDNAAIIGSEIAAMLFPGAYGVDKNITLFDRSYRIIGQLDSKGSTMMGPGDKLILIPIENATKINNGKDNSVGINFTVGSAELIENAENEIIGLLRTIRKDPIGQENSFEISKSNSLAIALNESLANVTIAASLIGFITLLGAAIGLMNIMLVSVTERTREIGVRKALGATPKLIRQQFLVEAIMICQMGGVFGIILGILLGNIVSFYLGGLFIIPWFWIICGLILCFTVGIISGYYPAWKASKLDPIESLRFE